MEQNGEELEYLALQIKSLTKTYLPVLSFGGGVLLTYAVLRFLLGYNETCASINEGLHAFPSAADLLNHKTTPGEFPISPSEKMIKQLEEELLAKNNEIAGLRKDLEGEDDELAELMAEKDDLLEQKTKELAISQAALKEKEKQILDLTVGANRRAREARKLIRESRLGKGMRDNSAVKPVRNDPPLKPKANDLPEEVMRNDLPARPESKLFKVFNGQLDNLKNEVRILKSQLLESDSLKTKHEQHVSELKAQLTQCQHEATSTEKSLSQRDRQIKELEHKLSQPRLDTERMERSLIERDQQINELQQQLSQLRSQAESMLIERDQEIKDLQEESGERLFDLGEALQSLDERNRRISELEAQYDQSTSYAQQSVSSAGIQITDLLEQLSQSKRELAIVQRTIADTEENSTMEKLEFAHVHEKYNVLKEKHEALEERYNACEAARKFAQDKLADADKLYKQYVDLCKAWEHAQSTRVGVIDKVVDQAMATVEWQLKGRSAEETEQKCKEIGERLGGRVKPMLDMIRGQMGKREEALGKRKMVVEEEEGEERSGKRQHQE